MVLTEEAEDHLFKKHQNLVNGLKLDEDTSAQAWNSYQSIRTNYTLEGDQLHWIGCAIFVACRSQKTPTIGGNTVEGNFVNLTSLLRYCNLSLQHFFNKIAKWADMANLSEDFRQKIEALEQNFAVSCNIFKAYIPMFSKIFKEPNDIDMGNRHRNRKQKCPPCNSTQLFEFIWHLFITVKGEDPSCSVDLVISNHLLQACCDLMFKNAFLDDRRDLLNPKFEGLPENWSSSDYIVPTTAPCIIDKLCVPDMLTEAKYIKQYSWRKKVQELFKKGVLSGDAENHTQLLNQSNFEQNFKNVTKAYEAYLLHKGDFDERIFLAEHRRRLILRETILNSVNGIPQNSNVNETGEMDAAKSSFGELTTKVPDTPLTNRKYLGPKEHSDSGICLTESQSILKLQALVNGRSDGPSEALLDIFKFCKTDPTERIQKVVKSLSDKFTAAYAEDTEVANQRLQVALKLFYKFLEIILLHEQTLNSDISKLVEQDRFYESLFACSLEVVISSYNSQRKFPWVLKTLEVQAFYFIRVIELIVRSKSLPLSREMVKHLNAIEETILDSELWRSDSIMWDELKKHGVEIPKFEDIALPGNMTYGQNKSRDSLDKTNPLQSPGPSAVDTFDSPMSNVKKQLFPTIKPGQSLLNQNQKSGPLHLMLTDQEGNKKLIPIVDTKVDQTPPQQLSAPSTPVQSSESQKPKKSGGFNIIFRKIYNLAGVRMDHLCNSMSILDNELKCKIWTAFEHCLRSYTELLRDRHLDQLLMCAVYVICKVTDSNEKTFYTIMQSYKCQPQATSDIYRNVLLFRTNEKDETGEVLAKDKRGTLIQFYNNVFVKYMTSFAVKFSSRSSQNSQIHLSPMPSIKSLLASPVHQITKNIFIKTHESPGSTISTGKSYNYYFSRSASKDLKDINRAINNNGVTKKRLLIDNSFDIVDNAKRLCSNRKVQTLLEERRNQNSE